MRGVAFTQDGKRYHQNYQFAELKIVEEVEGSGDLKGLRKKVEPKGCIEVSYRWITNFRPCERSEKRSNPVKPSTQDTEDPGAPILQRQLPTIGAIPEKVLKGDIRSHQAM
ncbi:hypothetical protein BU25DRAFT_450125 [Macroventuria anomochaeta]|uniref:Uncharacterized protein n=1 Tax=Macroventuria anomochaeta TaxID=301207 RepID=A0ACB6RVS2_9PLEO|nr:uncharacterized protein BU25DRAFT_450125 [Macroventuria anomochaeta]KAF2625377.1 hypothetical protein BU25DRAFT_450125 [Macroventuria anomochaeta]